MKESKMSNVEKETKKGFYIISNTIVYAFAIFGVLFILILASVMFMMNPGPRLLPIPEKTVLTVDFDRSYSEVRGDDLLAEFIDQPVSSVIDLIRAIHNAAFDPRVQAIYATVGQTPLSLAQIQDISNAVRHFRKAGKQAYLFSNTMGSFGNGSKEYYLGLAFDEIWMQPNSDLGLTGVNIEVPFFKNILNRIGVEAEFYSRYEYKNAAASLLDAKLKPAYQQELTRLGSGLFKQLNIGINLWRDIAPAELTEIFDSAPLSAEDALEAGLIDKVAYREDLTDFLNNKYNAEMIDIDAYISHIHYRFDESKPIIAVMTLEGVIENGKSSDMPVNDAVIGSETVVSQLKELTGQKNVKALILRINSPGGSYIASAEIWHALMAFKQKNNIPIVVSMSSYAASGGYFIALAGDYLVAAPATITGSIGVLGGKFVLADLWKKLNINWGEVKFGKNAGILSSNHKFSAAEKLAFNRSLDRIYHDFTLKVSQARHISMTELDKLARGRIWLGDDASVNGLVDEVGGFSSALLKAKELAGLRVDQEVNFLYYPQPLSFGEKLSRFLESGSLPIMKSPQLYNFDLSDAAVFLRLRHEAVLPPFKIKM